MNHPIPESLSLLVTRVRAAVDELAAARARLTSRKNIPFDTRGHEEDAMLERERAIGAMNALEFEIAPAIAELDLQVVVNDIAKTARDPRERHHVSSGCLIQSRGVVVTRPQRQVFLINEIHFDHPERWMVIDLRIGNRAQLDSPTPAALMHEQLLDLDPVQTAMDVELEVEYRGDDPAGEEFNAILLGHADQQRTMGQAEVQQIVSKWERFVRQPAEPAPDVVVTAAEQRVVLEHFAADELRTILVYMRRAFDNAAQRTERFLNDDGFGNLTTEGDP